MHSYPYTIENPATRKRVTISNDDDLKILFLSFVANVTNFATIFAFTQITICYHKLYDAWVNDMITRFNYCKQWNTQPYEGAYDDHPVVWKDVNGLISQTMNDLRNCQCHEHKPKVA